jgi:hypothetical protein
MADFTDKTFKETYRDFYDAEDGYHRVLFNSGKALQARELIESQTIIQEEIARFGRNIFKEGALVNPGGATVNNKLEYIRLDTSSIVDSNWIGKTLTNDTTSGSGIELKVLEIVDSVSGDPTTLYVQYTDTVNIADTTKAPRVSSLDTLYRVDNTQQTVLVIDDSLDSISASGRATKAHFSPGDFFVQGHFVYMEGGSSFISKYDSLPTADIGFLIEQNIITEDQDNQLYDNQGQVPNVSAPGAHRYQIKLIPTTRDQVLQEENFVFVARVVNGIITREVTTFDSYNRINDLLAQRTKEESGNYVVEDFKAIFEEKDSSNLNLAVTDGIAYVDGYRLDIGTTDITVSKSRGDVAKSNEPVPATYGNYVYIKHDETDPLDNSEGFGRLDVFGTFRLRNSSGNDIGFCNVRGIQRDPTGYRLYIFNIRMDSIFSGPPLVKVGVESFSSVVDMVDNVPSGSAAVIQLVDSVIHEASNNSLLFPLPQNTPKKDPQASNFTANYTLQRYFRGNPNSSGEISLSGVETIGWVITEADGPFVTDNAGDALLPDNTGKYTGLDPAKIYTIAYYVDISNAAARKKTIVTVEQYNIIDGVDDQARPIFTENVDGIELISVKWRTVQANPVDWSIAEDITHQFEMDGGQRDNFYDRIVMLQKSGYTVPFDGVSNTEVQTTYKHYDHATAGAFFSVSSYEDDNYEDIPDHVSATGKTISLRDVLDFRPSRTFNDPNNINEFTVTGELPQNASTITINSISYFLPRIDILVANATDSRGDIGFGELQVIQGESDISPREPEIPTGSMALYKFKLNPYTFNTADLTSTYIPNKRFTMKDIGKLEQRIGDLFELTTLSLLESDTNSLTVLDSNGNARTKAGFIADNFSTFDFSDINSNEYRASIDPQGLLKPSFRENSVRLMYSTDNISAVEKHGDLVTLPYTDVSLVSQLLATSTLNVNPFAVITQTGHMEISPSSDEWVETRDLPPIMQTTIRRMEDFTVRPTLQGDGRNRNNFSNDGLFTTISRDVSFRETNRSIQDFIGERITDIEIIPFMRSRKINFTAKGLRPNTKMFAFFGNKDVSSTNSPHGRWVREEATSSRFSDNPTEFGSEYANALEYPSDLGGPTDLITDINGELIGSFFLPNTPTISFRTGKQEFKLLDVSVNDEDEATVSTRAVYTSTGSIETVQRTIQTTRIVNPPRAGRQDPLAQTFFVDQIENPNGMFITKARIFVSSKDSSVPLQVQIRPVENGIPTTRIVPGAVKFLDPSQITIATNSVSNDGTSPAETIEDVQAYPTEVEFDEPIFLTSGEEYAIVLLAESVEYNVYVAQTYEFVFGSDEDKVSRQPSLGSLFLSQNGFTWTPDQTKDLMFELDRAEFSASGDLILDNAPLPKVTLDNNPLETQEGTYVVKVYHEGHGFSLGDSVVISNVTNSIGGIPAVDFEGTFSVYNVEWDGYNISVTTATQASSVVSALGGGNDVTVSQQVVYDEFVPQVQSLTPNKTRITSTLVNPIASSFGDTRPTAQFIYTSSNPNIVFLNDYNKNLSPSVVASSENASGVETMKFTLSLTTEDSKVSPVIDLQRVSVLALENVIDNDDAAQHITTPVVVDEASLGLKVIFAANRPSGANFEVYVRSSADEDSLVATDEVTGDPVIDWVLVDIDKALPTDDDPSTFRDYEFTHESDQFTVFQVKIVMQSNSSSKSPVIRDLRAIAMVV